MDEPRVLEFLTSVSVPLDRMTYAGDWINISCPLAPWTHGKGTDKSPSFGVLIKDDGPSVFHCFSCGAEGRLPLLAARLGKLRSVDYSKQIHWAELAELQATSARQLAEWDDTVDNSVDRKSKKDFIPVQSVRHSYPRAVTPIKYLLKRGIPAKAIWELDLKYDPADNRILFSIYDRDLRFRGFTGRYTGESKKPVKVKDYFGLNKDRLFLFNKPFLKKKMFLNSKIIVTEGLFDYANVHSCGYPGAHAALGAYPTAAKIEYLRSLGRPIFFFMDNDDAGHSAVFGKLNDEGELTERAKRKSWAWSLYDSIPVWIVPYPEGCPYNDPGEMTEKWVHKCVNSAYMFSGKTS